MPLRHAYSDGATPEFTLAFIADVVRHAALPVYGLQFHPEKSQRAGLALLANFLAWDGAV